jgi:hypothetical protein
MLGLRSPRLRVCGAYLGLVAAAPVSIVDQGFDVEFMEPGGGVRQGSLATCWDVRFEDAPPGAIVSVGAGSGAFPGVAVVGYLWAACGA